MEVMIFPYSKTYVGGVWVIKKREFIQWEGIGEEILVPEMARKLF
jgi:hypothetical protein